MKPVFLLICMLLSVSLVFGQLEKETNSEGQKSNDSYGPIDQMPEFWGGQKALHKFISSTLRYPEKTLKNKVSGVVYVSFMVKSSGYIENIAISKGFDQDCDQEAIRILKAMPRWKTGRSWKTGEPTDMYHSIPIRFTLPEQK